MNELTVGRVENLGEAIEALDEDNSREFGDIDATKAYILDSIKSGDFEVKEMLKLAEVYHLLCLSEAIEYDTYA